MLKRVLASLALAAALLGGCAQAWIHGGGGSVQAPAPAVFTRGVWYQDTSDAARAASARMTTYFGVGNTSGGYNDTWPERFGSDNGELAALRAAGLNAIGGIFAPSGENTSAASVASIRALDAGRGTVIGVVRGDEPYCGGPGPLSADTGPADMAAIKSYAAPGALVLDNQGRWPLTPLFAGASCLPKLIADMRASSVAVSDLYPATDPFALNVTDPADKVFIGDFATLSNDMDWKQAAMVLGNAHYAATGQPVWAYIESGGDNLGSGAPLAFTGSIASNVATITDGWSKFTSAWIGLSVQGRQVLSIVDATHATLATGADVASGAMSVTGGVNGGGCVASINLCFPIGTQYRASPADVEAQVWLSVLSGATGVVYFCHDTAAVDFCLTDATVSANLARINGLLATYAPVILSPTTAACQMLAEDFTTQAFSFATSCSNGILALASSGAPALAMVKSAGPVTYLFAQLARRSTASLTVSLGGLAGQTATVVYDSAAAPGRTLTLDGSGSFIDAFGAYQTKIYAIR